MNLVARLRRVHLLYLFVLRCIFFSIFCVIAALLFDAQVDASLRLHLHLGHLRFNIGDYLIIGLNVLLLVYPLVLQQLFGRLALLGVALKAEAQEIFDVL